MNEKKIMNLLHLARKAGKIKTGYDACEKSCFIGNSRLMIIASDLAKKTKKSCIAFAGAYNVKVIEFSTKAEISSSFKVREIGIISVEDSNFSKGIIDLV